MGEAYIPELGQILWGRQLDIWRGHDDSGTPITMDKTKQEKYRTKWRRMANLPQVPKESLPQLQRQLPPKPCNCGEK
ncbi:hypothetical protein FRUB_07011 [Fimbriiglobus ruber]|uniref:Uncharacterized protein n=1 Tax=Fimbriiglobus ruber TaxID=1908690 RepID=A0A225D8L1_9BACT|nr:hypothetical protein FRUB_07011 [Fimbriiglobus ruber]